MIELIFFHLLLHNGFVFRFYQVAVKLTEPVHPQAKLEVHILKTEDKDYFCPSRSLNFLSVSCCKISRSNSRCSTGDMVLIHN